MKGKSINRRKNHSQQITKPNIKKKEDIIKPNYLNFEEKSKKRIYLYAFLLIVITFAVFSPTFQNTYTNWDDGKYVDENPLIKPFDKNTVSEMFFSQKLFKRYWMGNYHPLTMLTLNINYALADKNDDGIASPFGFQLVNILLHILNTLLVFLLFRKLLKNDNLAFLAALLFGVHTLHVESVSWIAERKDVLYTFFFLSSLYLYFLYAKSKKITYFIFAFSLFVLSLLSKGQATSLAVSIILVDYFYERKLLSLKVILEKIPFLIVALFFGLIAIEAQRQGNALQVINSTPFFNRIGVAAFGFTMYLLKLILPFGLSAVYPYPDIIHQTIPFYFWLGLITVFLVAFVAYKSYRKDKILFFGIGFFAVNIVLLLQLLPVGSAIYADRYVYIPSIGFYLIVAYLIYKITKQNIKLTFTIIGIYAVLLSVLTIGRIGDWKDSRTLWEDVTAKQPKSVVAWNNLGSEYNRTSKKYFDDNDFEKYKEYKYMAINCFDNGIEQKPDYTSAFYNRGFSKYDLGDKLKDSALIYASIQDYNHAIATDLNFVRAYQQRASAYDWLGNYQQALSDYDYALSIRPNNVDILVNRGTTKGKTGDLQAALNDFNRAIELKPEMAQAYSNRGLAYAFLKQYDKAIADYNKAIQLEPSGNTFYNLGMVFINLRKNQEALDNFQEAINMNYQIAEVYFYKAISESRLSLNDQACADMKIAAQKGLVLANQQVNIFCE
ncbi:MAG: tetratricopeptide repeat protein [Bacteroidota bacterium]|nr:tetratricopeptide repeat protein [Bacteroidota bacterium]